MEKNPYFESLFNPIQIGHVTYKNRIVSSPLGNVSVRPDGSYPAASFALFEARARGGCAEVSASETIVDFRYGNRIAVPVVDYTALDSPHMRSLKRYPEMLHAYGAVATVELNHCGANRFASAGKTNPIGPSGFVREDGVEVTEMDEDLMEYVAGCFAQAAYYYQQAGYDGCIPHMASGWLLQQFFSPLTNHRTDAYGGSVENRARFPLRVLQAIREKCGDSFLILPRLSAAEYIPGGYGIDDALALCRSMEGLVDAVQVVAGVYYEPVRSGEFSSMYDPHGLHAELSAAVKKVCSYPVMLCGGINSPEQAEELIAQKKTDLVVLGRQMLADPDWAEKARTGRADDIARCLRCFRCFPGPLEDTGGAMLVPPDKKCTVNPRSDLSELSPPLSQWPAPTASRTVLVVGGGVAGLTAAYTAAGRGHSVILAEQSGQLGGLLNFTNWDGYKQDLYQFKELCIRRAKRAGVDIRLNTEVTPENIAGFGADAVILSVGSSPLTPPIAGIETTLPALEAYRCSERVGQRVILAGGGQVGCEIALSLAKQGKEVTIVEMREDVAVDAAKMHRVALMKMLHQSVTLRTGLRCVRFDKDGVDCLDAEGNPVRLDADTVVLAMGMRANAEAAAALQEAIPKGCFVQLVGDCVRASKIQTAVEEGFLAAMRIQ